MSADLLAIAWTRPWALALLAVPIALLWLARRRRAGALLATSDLELWRADPTTSTAPRPRRPRRIGWAHALALLALACAALAIAGPLRTSGAERWTCVIDGSASMGLAAGSATREEVAVRAARELARQSGAELVGLEANGGARVASAAEFAAHDASGVLWITDVVPSVRPRFAGFVASGGEAVPGPVSIAGGDRIDWDGRDLVRVPGAAPAREVRIAGIELDLTTPRAPFERVLAAWAAARGVALVPADDARTLEANAILRIHAAGAASEPSIEAGRDGWSAQGPRLGRVHWIGDASQGETRDESRDPSRDETRALVPWLRRGEEVLIAAGPGRIELGWLPGAPTDPAAFAVDWAALLDACATAPPGIVPLAERVAAGPAGAAAPAPTADAQRASFAWLLAGLAALFALGALLARRA